MSRESALAQTAAVAKKLDRAHIEAAVKFFLASYEAKDWQSRIALFADDAHFEDPVGAPPVLGKANLETFFRDTIGSGWDIVMESEKIIRSGDEALSLTRAQWGLAGTEPAKLTLVQHFVFNEAGKIKSLRIFFDEGTIA